jgi:hypothetical protein
MRPLSSLLDHQFRIRTGGNVFAVRRHLHGVDRSDQHPQGLGFPPRRLVPNSHLVVAGSGKQLLAVRRESRAIGLAALLALECANGLSACDIPQPDIAVFITRQDLLPIR